MGQESGHQPLASDSNDRTASLLWRTHHRKGFHCCTIKTTTQQMPLCFTLVRKTILGGSPTQQAALSQYGTCREEPRFGFRVWATTFPSVSIPRLNTAGVWCQRPWVVLGGLTGWLPQLHRAPCPDFPAAHNAAPRAHNPVL
jgi:hypothetical protein